MSSGGSDDRFAQLSSYAEAELKEVMEEMLVSVFKDVPAEPVDYMIQYLQDYKNRKAVENDDSTPLAEYKSMKRYRRREGVSAEPLNIAQLQDLKTRVVTKSKDDKERIANALKSNFLFSTLDTKELHMVVDAMESKNYSDQDFLIRQGDDGDEFFVLAEGKCKCFLNQHDGPPKCVKDYEPSETFGELALMYNVNRQASIRANGDVHVWSMDRNTFRVLVMGNIHNKRLKYEEFLSTIPLLSKLDKYERAKVADSLKPRVFKAGEYIINMGDTTDTNFYILVEGQVKATKPLHEGDTHDTDVWVYKTKGDHFGELALISGEPRAANVVAITDGAVVSMDSESFTRLLGPVKDILQRRKLDIREAEIDIIKNTPLPAARKLSIA